jgi:alpha,alpha-trehalase
MRSRSHSRTLALGALAAATLTALSPAESRQPAGQPPSILFPDLYTDVAASDAFEDFKSFADAVPLEAPPTILRAYKQEAPRSPAAIRKFVLTHFRFETDDASLPLPTPGLRLDQHIQGLWPHLTRQTLDVPPYSSALALPEPYIVPGGRFRELYYWDSYFTMLGFGPEQEMLRRGIITDFVAELRDYGHIPNGSRTYYLSRSQPPFFFKMVALSETGPRALAYAHFLPELKVEYAYWMRGSEAATPGRPVRNAVRMPNGAVLNRYWDERDTPRDESYPADTHTAGGIVAGKVYRDIRAAAESGWDFSSRWLADETRLTTIQTTDIVPPDLNSILFGLEQAIREGCEVRHDQACVKDFAARASQRRAAMRKYLWNGRFFDDYRWTDGRQLDHTSAAVLYPLFFWLASAQEARMTAVVTRKELVKSGGLVTTNRSTGQQWDSPNGWAPLQWIAVSGLRNYGENNLAQTIACRWTALVSQAYAQSGRLLEKYDVVSKRPGFGGEYPLQDGFGWTNGVTVALLRLYPHCNKPS